MPCLSPAARPLKGAGFATAVGWPHRRGRRTASVYERHHIGVTEATLPVSGLPPALDGLRIALLTDIHHSALVPADDVARAVELAVDRSRISSCSEATTSPNGDRAFVEPVAELLAPLRAPHGVFAILGNHDDDREMPAALARQGIRVLQGRSARGSRSAASGLELAGIRFWTRERPTSLAC